MESPYKGNVDRNVAYARQCLMDCLHRGEAPMASHLLYTQVLDDTIPEQRELGIASGFAWSDLANCSVFYCDLGWSSGMKAAYQRALELKRPVELRVLETKTTKNNKDKDVKVDKEEDQRHVRLFFSDVYKDEDEDKAEWHRKCKASVVQQVHELGQRRQRVVEFRVQQKDESNPPVFVADFVLDGKTVATGEGPSKSKAKENAASQGLLLV